MSLQREHRGTHEELESHERRNRIAGQSEDQRRAAHAERDRLPRLDRDAPEDLLDAELSLELADEVELSNRHASRGHEQIRLQAALERRPVRALVVRDGGGRTDFGARTRKRGGQHDAVRLVDLAWGEPFAGRLELAPCCNHRRVRAACATDLGDARGGDGADLRRPESPAPMSPPRGRTFAPRSTCEGISTSLSWWTTSSTGTTASAPSGTTPPVAIAKASRAASGLPAGRPAATVSRTGSLAGVSAART